MKAHELFAIGDVRLHIREADQIRMQGLTLDWTPENGIVVAQRRQTNG